MNWLTRLSLTKGLPYILICMCSQSNREGAIGYWLGRWFCVTMELSVATAVTITASYWLLLGGDDEYQYKFMNIHEHVMNTVLALTSFLFVKRAFTWWHVIFLWIFGIFYGLQNYLSYLGLPSRNNIYGLINWEDLHQEQDSDSRAPIGLILTARYESYYMIHIICGITYVS